MAVRAYSPVLPSVELFGAYEGIASATSINETVSLTFTPTEGNLTVVPYDGDDNIDYLQLEVGPTPSSYIPTSGATVTRAAETLTVPADNLPWPSPVVIGEELVTNGTFDTDVSGWTGYNYQGYSVTISSVSGELTVENDPVDGGNGAAYQAITTVIGATYSVSVDFISATLGAPKILIRNGLAAGSITETTTSGAGTYTLTFTATDTETLIIFSQNVTSAGVTTKWDNISVKEINPLSVSIQMKGEMTYADEDVAGQISCLNWAADSQNLIRILLDTHSTYGTGRLTFQQVESNTFDIVNSGNNIFSPSINVPFNIASRHGSTFLNGAVGGTTLTANTTPTALPDLSATDLQLGYDFNGTISLFRIWADDIGDVGISEAST